MLREIMIKVAMYVVLSFFVVVMIFPFLYLISLSLQSDKEIFAFPPKLIPERPLFSNFLRVWRGAPFARFILNSLIVAGAITVSHLFFDPLAGYVFAKFRFPGRDFLFMSILGTLMIPFFLRMIPLFYMFVQVRWVNTYQSLIIPFAMSGFGIFFMRQFILPLPNDLIEAARIDGCPEFSILIRIILPLCKPAIATLALFTFVFQWNEFLWPLIITSSLEMRTLSVGLTLFSREYFTQWNLVAPGAVILFIPGFLLFLFAQKYFVKGIALSGLR
ncbi:MAG: carbohydrate ABC transporter permease [bacterium]